MKAESGIFGFMAAFFFVVTGIYWWLSRDPTGTACLALTFGLSVIIGYYLWFTGRRMEARPEDRGDAEISEGSGEIGFFPPHSWWPIMLAGSFALTLSGIAFGRFIMVIGFALVVVTAMGFLFEYYVGINRSQGQTLGALEATGEKPTSTHKFLGD